MPPAPPFDPRRDRPDVVAKLLAAYEAGARLRKAAEVAGVHVATVCRWQLRSPELAAELRAIAVQVWEREVQKRRAAPRPRRVDPLSVPCHPLCPQCRGPAGLVRSASGRLYFWQCYDWPDCPWRSWRPRYPHDCPECGTPRFWSYDRRSIHCSDCCVRTKIALEASGC
jgi:hypothetical protein